METQKVSVEILVKTLKSLKDKPLHERKVRISKDSLEELERHLGTEEFLELIHSIVLYSDKAGHNFVQIRELRKKVSQ
jgi:uncharacterized FAD-dependent dehydrogenase